MSKSVGGAHVTRSRLSDPVDLKSQRVNNLSSTRVLGWFAYNTHAASYIWCLHGTSYIFKFCSYRSSMLLAICGGKGTGLSGKCTGVFYGLLRLLCLLQTRLFKSAINSFRILNPCALVQAAGLIWPKPHSIVSAFPCVLVKRKA